MHTNKFIKSVALLLAFISAANFAKAKDTPTVSKKKKNAANAQVSAKVDFDWDKHVTALIQYPTEALEAGIWGDVTVEFTVSASGQVTLLKSRGDSKLLRQEAERLVRQTEGLWQSNSTAERTISQKISFRLQMDFSDNSN